MEILQGYKTIREAAEITGFSESTIQRYVTSGVFHNVTYSLGFVGRPAALIPDEQVYMVKKMRDKGAKQIRALPEKSISEQKLDIISQKVKDLDNALDGLIAQLMTVQGKLDDIKELIREERNDESGRTR